MTELTLDARTLEVMKSFAGINSGLYVQPGNVLTTIAPRGGPVLARVVVPAVFPVAFCVYDLQRFLAALGLFDKPHITFFDGQVEIRDAEATEAGLVMRYPLTRPNCIDYPQEKVQVNPTVFFSISRDRLRLFAGIGRDMDLPHLILSGSNGAVLLSAADASKPEESKVGGRMPMAETNEVFRLVFAADDWRKILWTSSVPTKNDKGFEPASYRVGLGIFGSTNGIAHFVSEDEGKGQYWIGTRIVGDARFGGRKK
jgi:hypothetical protein